MALKKIILNGTEIELPSGGGGGNVPTKTSELTNDSGFITSADNVASASKLQTMRYINGSPFDGSGNVVSYAVCTTASATTAKTVSISRFSLATGSQVRVKFSNANTASAPTLNVGSTGAKRMSYKGNLITNANFSFDVNKIYTFTYDGTNWVIEGDWDSAKKQDTLVSGTNIKTINGQSLLGSGDITVQGGGSSEGGSSAYPEVYHGTSYTRFGLKPNTFYIWDEVASLDLSLRAETSGVANEYLFQFTSGSTPTTLTLPDDIKFSEDLVIEANKIYQISILKGLGSALSWDSVTLIENKATYDEGDFMNGGTLTFEYPTASEIKLYLNQYSSPYLTIPAETTTIAIDWNEPSAPIPVHFDPSSDNTYIYIIA